MAAEGTIEDATAKVSKLISLPLPEDQASIAARPLSVFYHCSFNSNFEDKGAFLTGNARFLEEAQHNAKLNELLEEGEQFAVMLYTWRSLSRAIPTTNEEAKQTVRHERTLSVLEPHVRQLSSLMDFHIRATQKFAEEVQRVCQRLKNEFVSEAYLLTLGKFLNMFVVLDELKNMKAGLNNDYSRFRRAAQVLGRLHEVHSAEHSHELSVFLGNQNVIRDTLTTALKKVEGFEELLAEIVRLCVSLYEQGLYVKPEEKHMLVKVMVFGLTLIDSCKGVSIYKLDDRKKLNLRKIEKIIKKLAVLPLYGDMQMSLCEYIQNLPNFDSSKWNFKGASGSSCPTDLLGNLTELREEHHRFVSQLSCYSSKVQSTSGESTDEWNRKLYNLALRGLKQMSVWTLRVQETFSWKLTHPTCKAQNPRCPEDAEAYQLATQYNYSSDEKFAMVELIAMIKSSEALLARAEPCLSETVCRVVYGDLQQFAQHSLREPLRRATKAHKDIARLTLLGIQDIAADWPNGSRPSNDPAMAGQRDPPEGFKTQVSKRTVPPSDTQLYMVRTMLESLVCERGGKAARRKDLDQESVRMIEEFLRKAHFWPYLLDYAGSLRSCCDLSQLWYREFFLEMTRGERIQFPIAMSMPWILTDHILETKHAAMMQYVLYPLDLYNDSADFALTRFKKQFLYDEIEAEVNLCFDQFVYKMAQQILRHYKRTAASQLLARCCRSRGEELASPPAAGMYEPVMQQRHVQLLGRSIDFNHLLSQRLNAAFLKSLDVAFQKLESCDFSAVLEFEALLSVNRRAHGLLAERLNLSDFDELLQETNQSVTTPYGRLTLYALTELCTDVLPKYCYNASTSRFVRSALPSSTPQREKVASVSPAYLWGSKLLNSAFSAVFSRTRGFVGGEHLRALCRLLGCHGVAALYQELTQVACSNIRDTLTKYVSVLNTAMPKVLKNHLYNYTSLGILQYLCVQFQNIVKFAPLRTDVFQSFTELGNTLLFCRLLEQQLCITEVTKQKQAALFQNAVPKPLVQAQENKTLKAVEKRVQDATKDLENKYASLHVVSAIGKLGKPEQHLVAEEGGRLTGERLYYGHSLFEFMLRKIRECLRDEELAAVWRGSKPSNGVLSVEKCEEFHRLWSAIQFIYCTPPDNNHLSVEQMFGEGLQWAGCTLIYFLDQQRRFEALEPCYHLARVHHVDQLDGVVEGIQLEAMVNRIEAYQVLNTEVFTSLQRHLSPEVESVTHLSCFSPPVHPGSSTAL